MKKIIADKKSFILCVGAALVLGALIARAYYPVGKGIVIFAVALYLLAGSRTFFLKVMSFGRLSPMSKLTTVTYALLFCLLFSVILGGPISYFFILVMLGIDFFVYDKQSRR